MKKKRWLAAFFISFILSGCSGDKVSPSNVASGDMESSDSAYLVTFQDITLENLHDNRVLFHDNALFYINSIIKDGEAATVLRCVSLLDGSYTDLILTGLRPEIYINGLAINTAGNFILLGNEYKGPDERLYTIHEYSINGSLIKEMDITAVLGLRTDEVIQSVHVDAYDRLCLGIETVEGKGLLIALDREGKLIHKLENDYPITAIFDGGGDITYFFEVQNHNFIFREVDFMAGRIGESIELTGISQSGLKTAVTGTNSIYFLDNRHVFQYNPANGSLTKLLNFSDWDITGTLVAYFGRHDDGSFWLVEQNEITIGTTSQTSHELLTLTPVPYEELPERIELVYATMWYLDDGTLAKAIIDFNRRQPEYRVTVKNYASSDFDAGFLRFSTDLIGAETPDLISMASFNHVTLAMQGILLDLHPNLNMDWTDYWKAPFEAYEIDGGLYALPFGVTIRCLSGRTEYLDGIESWNLTEMFEWAGKYPDKSLIHTVPIIAMQFFVTDSLDEFIDWDTGICDFTSPDFIKVLEYAASLNDPAYNADDRNDGLREGRYLLNEHTFLRGLNNMQFNQAIFGGEDICYIGFPSTMGSGFRINPMSDVLGVHAKSGQKEGAMAFLSYLLSDRFQEVVGPSAPYAQIPVKLSAIEAMVTRQTTPLYRMDENGREAEMPTYSISLADDSVLTAYNSLNQAYVEDFYDIIARADTLETLDINISMIIEEESAPYFAGQKSAEEVADIIQNRVQVFINENYR